jgi:hypothetical protein
MVIIRLPSSDGYTIKGENIVIVGSSLSSKSMFTTEERYKQTLYTLKSIREKIPNPTIVFLEISPIPEEMISELSKRCDYFIYCANDPIIQSKNHKASVSWGETALIYEAITHLSQEGDIKRIYKAGGRYYLTDRACLNSLDYSKFNFTEFFQRQQIFYTTFYTFPANDIPYLIELLKKCWEEMRVTGWLSIEMCYAKYIPKEKVNILSHQGYEGYGSIRFYDDDTPKQLNSM